jgi:hypothetical protein
MHFQQVWLHSISFNVHDVCRCTENPFNRAGRTVIPPIKSLKIANVFQSLTGFFVYFLRKWNVFGRCWPIAISSKAALSWILNRYLSCSIPLIMGVVAEKCVLYFTIFKAQSL